MIFPLHFNTMEEKIMSTTTSKINAHQFVDGFWSLTSLKSGANMKNKTVFNVAGDKNFFKMNKKNRTVCCVCWLVFSSSDGIDLLNCYSNVCSLSVKLSVGLLLFSNRHECTNWRSKTQSWTKKPQNVATHITKSHTKKKYDGKKADNIPKITCNMAFCDNRIFACIGIHCVHNLCVRVPPCICVSACVSYVRHIKDERTQQMTISQRRI